MYYAQGNNEIKKKNNQGTTSLITYNVTDAEIVSVALDSNDDLHFVDNKNSKVVKYSNSAFTIVVSTGLNKPQGIIFDRYDNLFIADSLNNRIRKVDQNGVMTTIVGTGTQGTSENGTDALSCNLNNPYGLALDTNGLLYFSELGNHVVRKIDENDKVQTIAGTGVAGYYRDQWLGFDTPLDEPRGITISNTNRLYIADTNNNKIRKVNLSHGYLFDMAGDGTASYGGDNQLATKAQLNKPYGVFVDNNEDVFVADRDNKKVRKIGGLTQSIFDTILSSWRATPYSTDENYGRIEYWNTKDVTDMSGAFMDLNTFNEDLTKWNTSKVTTMACMFKNATSFNQDISKWVTNNVNTMRQMFMNAADFEQEQIANWNISNIWESTNTNLTAEQRAYRGFDEIFKGATKMLALGAPETPVEWNLSSTFFARNVSDACFNDVLAMYFIDSGYSESDKIAVLDTYGPISNWKVKFVTDMSGAFMNRTTFNEDISSWNVSNVTNMKNIFKNASVFNSPLDKWNISKLTDLDGILSGASGFNQPLNSWNTLNVTSMIEHLKEHRHLIKILEVGKQKT